MLEDLTLFSMAQRSMDWLAKRQSVLASNVANANTPGYHAKDLKPLDFKTAMADAGAPLETVTTNPMHVSASIAQPVRSDVVTDRHPEESKPDGNSVLIEDQMEKIGDVKGRYELAANLFQKNLNLIKLALGRNS